MPGRPDLAAIASITPASFSEAVFRVVPEALRERILSTEGNRYYPGRHHVAGETGILYTSLREEVAVREFGRHAARANLRGSPAAGRIKARLRKVLDLTDEANLRRLGLSREDLISPNYALTQAVGFHARKAGFQGLLVASAAGEGKNPVIFENNLAEGCSIEVEEIRVNVR